MATPRCGNCRGQPAYNIDKISSSLRVVGGDGRTWRENRNRREYVQRSPKNTTADVCLGIKWCLLEEIMVTAFFRPWVFGLVWHKRDGTQELRMFHVLRRNEQTLRPIVERNIAGGSHIYSDEWMECLLEHSRLAPCDGPPTCLPSFHCQSQPVLCGSSNSNKYWCRHNTRVQASGWRSGHNLTTSS